MAMVIGNAICVNTQTSSEWPHCPFPILFDRSKLKRFLRAGHIFMSIFLEGRNWSTREKFCIASRKVAFFEQFFTV